MSQFRFEKRRIPADLVLSTGSTVHGCFFVAGATTLHGGASERVGDVLNAESGFFPFERADGTTALYHRRHVVLIALASGVLEAELAAGYDVAPHRAVDVLLSTGARVAGTVAVYRPAGHDRLSDYAQSDEQFRYVVTPDQTFIVNANHIVALVEQPRP
jgi:hypothetical protein